MAPHPFSDKELDQAIDNVIAQLGINVSVERIRSDMAKIPSLGHRVLKEALANRIDDDLRSLYAGEVTRIG